METNLTRPITLLAIESSCDETAAAVVHKHPDEKFARILSSVTATSLLKHKITKGIVPEVAAREQLKYILPVIEDALKKAGVDISNTKPHLDCIAVTTGPGLVGSLLVGIETARSLAATWNLPIIPVNHIEAHPYANFVTENTPEFPILSWVISGGHTTLSLVKSHQEINALGSTLDDAAGECFDKCARVLGFDYPGGPFIEKLAEEYLHQQQRPPKATLLPRPLSHKDSFDVSFSGLKTAFLRLGTSLTKEQRAYELQEAIVDIIVKRTQQALQKFPEIRSVCVSGGVAANKRLKEKLSNIALPLYFPPLDLCTDNAAMIGAYAVFHLEKQKGWENTLVSL